MSPARMAAILSGGDELAFSKLIRADGEHVMDVCQQSWRFKDIFIL